ncbi:MAG: replicative DNA helicase [Acidobacteriota bacterium]
MAEVQQLKYQAHAEGRVPPQATDIEMAVLGAMLLEKNAIARALEILDDSVFYKPAHQNIFKAIVCLFERNEAVDSITLAEELKRRGQLDQIGGPVYLSDLTMRVTSAANIEYHAKIVLEKSLLRNLIGASSEISSRAFNEAEDALDLLDEAEQTIFKISEKRLKKSFTSMGDAVFSTMEMLERIHGSSGGVTGVPSGFSRLDNLTGGFQPSDLVIIAARPSMGKTAFVLSVARNAAADHAIPVGFFSLEMSAQQLVLRLICAEARVDAHSVRTGRLPDDQWRQLSTRIGKLYQAKIFIDDTPALGILELRAKARRLKVEHNIGMIIVDYLQLMQGPKSAQSREQEISMISRSLKALAKELNIPVLALSQLNRSLETRPDKRPMLSDLRECVVGETLVLLADGRRVAIRDLVGSTPEVFAVDEHHRIVTAQSDKVWRVGIRPVYRLRLASGRTFRATAKHRMLSGAGWKQIAELSTGDRIALARRLPEPEETLRWPDERVILLGHLIGDGSYLSHQPLRYTTADEDNSRAVREAVEHSFGTPVTRREGPTGTWHQLLIGGNGNRWHHSGVGRWLRELGIWNQRSYQKRIPEEAFRLGNDQIALLLRHLWATDGCLWCRPTKNREAHPNMYFATVSEGLAQDVSALLLRLGIVARIHSVAQKSGRPLFTVRISGAMQQVFRDAVGFFGPRARHAQELDAWLKKVHRCTNVDTLPLEIWDRVRASMQAQNISQRAMASLRQTSYGGTSHFRFAPSRTTVEEYAGILEDEALLSASSDDLFWDRIVAIEPAGEEEVFDLTVPGPSSWIADSIVTHNSGAIEQDADVVIFVHRPEKYGMTKDDGSSAEGIAEIIVGKHRNGPTDEVEVAFIKQYARFENLALPSFENFAPPPSADEPVF